ncbi:MAG: dUTP diphosphatase [Deltaproteobacteria bacterium]|nr:dUTP diphosphatase [Deltaproteobacteria bacterium]
MQLKVKRVRANHDIPLPRYQSLFAAGMDLMADVQSDICLKKGQRALVPTGISVEIPLGHEAQVRARSGLAIKKGIALVNSPGTIDADYRGEVCVILINLGEDDFVIKRGDRIAQMVIAPVVKPEIVEVLELSTTDRGSGGFGSTGGS